MNVVVDSGKCSFGGVVEKLHERSRFKRDTLEENWRQKVYTTLSRSFFLQSEAQNGFLLFDIRKNKVIYFPLKLEKLKMQKGQRGNSEECSFNK